jgi:histone deacetylase complex regulatory component SIN3
MENKEIYEDIVRKIRNVDHSKLLVTLFKYSRKKFIIVFDFYGFDELKEDREFSLKIEYDKFPLHMIFQENEKIILFNFFNNKKKFIHFWTLNFDNITIHQIFDDEQIWKFYYNKKVKINGYGIKVII